MTIEASQDASSNQTTKSAAQERSSVEQRHSQVQLFLGIPFTEIEQDPWKERSLCSALEKVAEWV